MDNKSFQIIKEDRRKRNFYEHYLTYTTELDNDIIIKEVFLNPEADMRIDSNKNCFIYAITGDIYINGKFCDENNSCMFNESELHIKNLYNFSVIHFVIIELNAPVELSDYNNCILLDSKNKLNCLFSNDMFSISLGSFNYKEDYSIVETTPKSKGCIYALNGTFESEGIKIESGEHIEYSAYNSFYIKAQAPSSVFCFLEFKANQGLGLASA